MRVRRFSGLPGSHPTKKLPASCGWSGGFAVGYSLSLVIHEFEDKYTVNCILIANNKSEFVDLSIA